MFRIFNGRIKGGGREKVFYLGAIKGEEEEEEEGFLNARTRLDFR